MNAPVISPKKYGLAVALCMIFGTLGVHHFYLGNWIHGLLDLGALIIGLALIISTDGTLALIGVGLIVADVIHTLVMTILLLIGSAKDGRGRIVAYPGQHK